MLLLAVSAAGPGSAQTDSSSADSARKALVLQKVRLVEQLLTSPRAREIGSGGDADARAALARADALLAEGRKAAEAGDAARAESTVDQALKVTSAAMRARGARDRADAALSQRNAELREQVAGYRNALVAAGAARPAAARPQSLAALDQAVADAQRAAAAGRQDEANRALAEAYRIAVAALAELRAGETIRIELKFDTPADEFAYEQKRFRSHELLVDVAIAERAPTAAARAVIEQELSQARTVRAGADARAAAGDHAAAIKLMEEANGHLVRALQTAGMPVFR